MEQRVARATRRRRGDKFRTVLSEFVQRNGAGDELAAAPLQNTPDKSVIPTAAITVEPPAGRACHAQSDPNPG